MIQQDKIILVDYLVSAFTGKVVLDKLYNFRPRRRQQAKSNTPTFRLNLFPWQEEILLGIKDDMFAAEPVNAIDRETQNLCYILLCNWNPSHLNNGIIFLKILSELKNLLLIKSLEPLKITQPSCLQKNLIDFWI
jgi:hypothetical protein